MSIEKVPREKVKILYLLQLRLARCAPTIMEMRIILTLLLILIPFTSHAVTRKKIIFLGDSLTEGYGVQRDQAFPALVQKKSDNEGKNWQIINAGISGSTTSSGPSRVQWVIKEKPDLIVLLLGSNDGLRGVPVLTMQKNLTDTIEL